MRRTFLTKTARTQKQSVFYFRDPFRLVPIENIAEIADKFTRNEIVTANEMRQVIGMAPSKEAKADKLTNSNMPVQKLQPNNGSGNGNGNVNDPAITEALAKARTRPMSLN
jgi:hypothetical protein